MSTSDEDVIARLRGEGTPGPLRDLVGYGEHPPVFEWPEGRPLALNFVINYEEGSEGSWAAGDAANEGLIESGSSRRLSPLEGYRDLHGESAYEYGGRAGIWRLLRTFADYGCKTTVFAAAAALELHPAVAEAITRDGHEPCSHGWRWGGAQHWQLSREEERDRIGRAIESFERLCGARPVGWYCRYGPSLHTRELLVEEGGFLYDSDSYADDLPFYVRVGDTDHLVIPYTMTYNDTKLVTPEGVGASRLLVDECRRAIDELLREAARGTPKMMTIGLHSRIAGHPSRPSAVREIIEYALERDVWIARRCDIARWWLQQQPAPH